MNCFGDHYSGEMNLNGERHGFGLCFFANGNFYEGAWEHDYPNGPGRLIMKTLVVIEGDFIKGLVKW